MKEHKQQYQKGLLSITSCMCHLSRKHTVHTFPNGLFLFTAGLFYKKWDGSKISPILLFCFCDNIFVPVIFSDHRYEQLWYRQAYD